MNIFRHTRKVAVVAGLLMTGLATSVQAMPFCGKSGYRPTPYPVLGYAPPYYGPAYYGYGTSVPNMAYPRHAPVAGPHQSDENKQREANKGY